MRVWFTGCTHFDHKNIIRLANRPFRDVDEMNEELIRRWNAVVGTTDFVYHLGDVGWNPKRLPEHMSRLNGLKFIVLGNHDDAREIASITVGGKRAEHNGKSTNIVGYANHEMIKPEGDRGGLMPQGAHLYHYPVDDWNGRWKGSLHLHAHTHTPILRWHHPPLVGDEWGNFNLLGNNYPPEVKCNRFCVGVDSTAFAPISMEEIMEESRRDDD